MDVSVLQALPKPQSTKTSTAPLEVTRRSANYHPSIWGDYFLKYSASHVTEIGGDMEKLHQRLKEEVRKMVVAGGGEELPQKLMLIDAVQRLGISYHFESEIEAVLEDLYHSFGPPYSEHLHTVSLFFRLLRQQGYPLSCDVFNRFKDNCGKFKECLRGDVKGMLCLYEASHLRVKGEDILDEALVFTTTHLQFLAPNLPNPLAAQVSHALQQPIRTGLTRLEARRFISLYEDDESHNRALLDFAKLDFNHLQKLHQRELSEITRWWKELDFTNKLPFARDRLVECYFWILGVYFEPHYLLARRILTKVISLTSIIDDIYDVYGTLEELVLFTDAIQRWDKNAKDQLPEYMRLCYEALLDVYSMIDEEMAKKRTSYRVDYAKFMMKDLIKAYFEEAKWFHEGHVPTFNEYMRVALVTGAYSMLATTSFVGMGELATKEVFDWVSSDPLILQASSVICRLSDDIVEHRFEQRRGNVVSAVECYMKECGLSEEEVFVELQKKVGDAWKDVNGECLRPTAVPMPLLMRVLNLARVINVLYKDEDGYTHSGTKAKSFVTSLLIDPVPINV